MNKSKRTPEPNACKATLKVLIMFKHGEHSYRMKVANWHASPGDLDQVEVASVDMLGGIAWTTVRNGSPEGSGPTSEWLIRRALWKILGEPGSEAVSGEIAYINLGDV